MVLLSVFDTSGNPNVFRHVIFFYAEDISMKSVMKTCLCNIQRYFLAIKIENFIQKNSIF